MPHEAKARSVFQPLFAGVVCAGMLAVLLGCDKVKTTPAPSATNPTTAVRTNRALMLPPAPVVAYTVAVAVESAPQFSTDAPSFNLTANTNTPPSTSPDPSTTKRGVVSLAWDSSSDPTVSKYRIYYGTNSQSYYASMTVGDVRKVLLTGLDEGVKYYAAATSINNLGIEGQFSNEVSFTTPFYISLTRNISSIEAFGSPGKTNRMMMSTNLTDWQTVLEWVGNSKLTNALHTNVTKAFFRVEVR